MASSPEDIPTKYRACVYDKPGKISTKVVELDVPQPGLGQVLVRLTHSGVCHSDLSLMLNAWPSTPIPAGQVGGHEGVGTVVALGPGDSAGLQVGDRVGIKWMSSVCGYCAPCLAGHDACCHNGRVSGQSVPGTFARFALTSANYVTPIPDGVGSAEAAPMLCGGITAYAALRKCGAISGQWVAMFGAGGGLGHLGVQMAARGMGFRVIGIDHSSKRDVVLAGGAEYFVAFDDLPPDCGGSLVRAVRSVSGGLGVHAAINFASNVEVYATAIKVLRFGGRLACVGIPAGQPRPIPAAGYGYRPPVFLSVHDFLL